MGEKKMRYVGPATINQIVKTAQDLLIKREDVVEFIQLPEGFVLIYFG